jgi:hypothetical protein
MNENFTKSSDHVSVIRRWNNNMHWAVPQVEPFAVQPQLDKVSSCRRRLFSAAEDRLLAEIVKERMCQNWFEVSRHFTGKTARQCKDRWCNYLSPEVSFAPWTAEEDDIVVGKVNELDKKWSLIAKFVRGRSENALKNHWYSSLRQKCARDQDGKWRLRIVREARPEMEVKAVVASNHGSERDRERSERSDLFFSGFGRDSSDLMESLFGRWQEGDDAM